MSNTVSAESLRTTILNLLREDGFQSDIVEAFVTAAASDDGLDVIRARLNNIRHDLQKALSGEDMDPLARQVLIRGMDPEARLRLSEGDLEALQREAVDAQKQEALGRAIGDAVVDAVIARGLLFLPV